MILKELINKFDKSSIKAGEGLEKGQFPLYTCSPLVNKYLDDYICDGEAIVISTGGNFAVHYVNGKFNYSTDCYVFNTDKLDTKYLYYYLISKTDDINKLFRGAGLKHLNKNEFLLMNVDNIDIQNQKRIVEHLDKISNLIELRKKQVNKCDNLIKSQFVEMFKYEFNIKKIKELSSYLSRGKSPNYVENSEIKVINQACIYWNEFRFENVKYQDETKISRSLDKLIKYNDVLITSTGTGTLGRCNVFRISNDKYMADGHVSILRFITDQINPLYFKYYFIQDKIQEKLYSDCVNGSTNQIELSKDKFQNFDIIVPPIELQNKFAKIVEQIDKQKFEFEMSLKKLEEMQAALMQEYFG